MLLSLQKDFSKKNNMCTITLSYDHNNALARRKLAALLSSGLFTPTIVDDHEPSSKEIEAHKEMVEAILHSSKNSMSHVIARYFTPFGNH